MTETGTAAFTRPYKLYVTVVLTLVYVMNQVDRAVFGFVMEPIKREFGLSDAQLGFLAGPALVFVYAVLGVPVARLADRTHRVNLMSAAIALWSAIAACGALVGNFWQLALARMGVGVGEAGFAAVAQSVLGSYHSASERTRALSIFMLAIPFGGVVSSLLAGWVNEAWGWRAVFLAAGLPGLALALLLKLTVQEPARQAAERSEGERPSLLEAAKVLWRRPALRHLCLAMTLLNVVTGSAATWLPTFFLREHGMGTAVLGMWFALVTACGAIAGASLSWWYAGRARGLTLQFRVLAVGALLLFPILTGVLLSPAAWLALGLVAPVYILKSFLLGPLWSLLQEFSAAWMRATLAALVMLAQTVVAGILAAPLVGVLSDAFQQPTTGRGLQAALGLVFLCALWAAWHLWLAARPERRADEGAGVAEARA